MKLIAASFGDIYHSLPSSHHVHIPSIHNMYSLSSQDPHSHILLRHQFEVQILLSKSGPDMDEASQVQFLQYGSSMELDIFISPCGFELLLSVLSFYLAGLH